MTDVALSWGEIFSAIGIFLTLVTLLTGSIFAVYRQIRATKTELDAFKLEVAKNYVENSNLVSMKQDLIRSEEKTLAEIRALAEGVVRLSERLDRLITNIQK